MNALKAWQSYAQGLEDSLTVGRQMVAEGRAYVYRVAHSAFEVAFVRYLATPQATEWADLLNEALALFALSVKGQDTQVRRDYPFNLAALLLEWHLGQWWLGEEPDPALLDQSINLYAEGLWAKPQRPLSAMSVLPPAYLLRQDTEHLANFWSVLNKTAVLESLPNELALWRSWSVGFLESRATPDAFWVAYATFARGGGEPTTRPARFYLAAAKIGRDVFGISEPLHAVLHRLAIGD